MPATSAGSVPGRQVVGGGHPFDGDGRQALAAVDQHVVGA